MKTYSVEDIIRDVRIAIDQNTSDNGLSDLGDVETLSLDEIIKSKIVESVRIIHSAAPVYLLDGVDFENNIYWSEVIPGDGYILLPDDFMRLIMFRMNDWRRAIYTAITPDNPEYMKQSSIFKGCRGNRQNPVCAVVVYPEGKALEFYSCKDNGARISEALYMPYPEINRDNDSIKICERCYKAVIYQTAAMVFTTLGDGNRSNTFNELSKSILI